MRRNELQVSAADHSRARFVLLALDVPICHEWELGDEHAWAYHPQGTEVQCQLAFECATACEQTWSMSRLEKKAGSEFLWQCGQCHDVCMTTRAKRTAEDQAAAGRSILKHLLGQNPLKEEQLKLQRNREFDNMYLYEGKMCSWMPHTALPHLSVSIKELKSSAELEVARIQVKLESPRQPAEAGYLSHHVGPRSCFCLVE